MDREILFRGQTRKKGEKVNMAGKPIDGNWVYGGIFQGSGGFSIIYGSSDPDNITASNLEKHIVHTDTVGQYTGKTVKTGKVFEDIEAARARTCRGHACDDCHLGQFNQGELYGGTCAKFVKEYPTEAARLMGVEVVEDDIDLINRISEMPLTESEVYTFSMRLCDNEVGRDYERFSIQALEKMSEMFIGKCGILGRQCSARIYRTELVRDSETITEAGDEYCYLKCWAYMLCNEQGKDVIAEIESGIKKEVSVGCAVERSVCSICGADIVTCPHAKGKTYDGLLCFAELRNPTDVFEWSFVATPVKKEEPMEKKEKPRICEVLGVEVGEVFTADTPYGRFQRCVIDEEGQILNTGTNVLCYMLNHPDRIIRKPRFTEEEVADAKALMRILGATGIERTAYGGNLCAVIGEAAKVVIGQGLFPSLRPGQAVKLSEVIGP